MNLVGVLDTYGLSLLEDPDYLRILAFLLRNRSASAEELANDVGKSKPRVVELTRALYKAGWITISRHDRLFLKADRESFLDEWGLAQLAIDSLCRELTHSADERAVIKSSSVPNSWPRRRSCLHSLQAAYWAEKFLPERDDAVNVRARNLLMHEACHLDFWLAAADSTATEDKDKRNLWLFWNENKLPTDAVSRNVTLRSVYLIIVYWSFSGGNSKLRGSAAQNHDPLKIFWAEHVKKHHDAIDTFANVLSNCVATFEKPRDEWELLEIIQQRIGKTSDEDDDRPASLLLRPAEEPEDR